MAEERPFVRPVVLALGPVPYEGPPVSLLPEPPDPPAAETRRRRLGPVVGGLAVLVIVLLVAGVVLLPRGGHRAVVSGGAVIAPASLPDLPTFGPAGATSGGPEVTHSVVPTHSSTPTGSPTPTFGAGQTPSLMAPHHGDPTVDLALHRPTSESGHIQVYPSGNATDGDPNTYWESPGNAFPQYIEVDLGADYALRTVVVLLPPSSAWGPRTETFAVLGGDGSDLTTLAGSSGHAFDPATGNRVSVGVNGTARYVRLVFTDNTVQHSGQLSELQIYD